MNILDNVIILALIAGAFFLGKKISDNYNSGIIEHLLFQLRLNSAEKGVGYVAPPTKRKLVPIGQDFMDKLKETGHATQSLRTPHT